MSFTITTENALMDYKPMPQKTVQGNKFVTAFTMLFETAGLPEALAHSAGFHRDVLVNCVPGQSLSREYVQEWIDAKNAFAVPHPKPNPTALRLGALAQLPPL